MFHRRTRAPNLHEVNLTVKRMIWISLGILFLILCAFGLWFFAKKPSHAREWQAFSAVLPVATLDEKGFTINNLRDFDYYGRDEIKTERYLDKTYRWEDLETVWFLKEDFADFGGFAHTFLSFGFRDGDYLSLSIEARKEEGEVYSGWKGLWRTFELMYIAGTERDFIGRRSHHSRVPVFLYPVNLPPEGVRALLRDILERMNQIHERAEFYNTLSSNCTNNLYRHAKRATGVKIPVTINTLFPGYSDKAAYKMGIIPNDLPFEENRATYRIDPDRVSLHDPEFSSRIREFGMPGQVNP